MNLFHRLAYIFLLMVVNEGTLAENNLPTVMVSGVLAGSEGSVQMLKELDVENQKLLSGEYRINADVRFKSQTQNFITEQPLRLLGKAGANGEKLLLHRIANEDRFEGFDHFEIWGEKDRNIDVSVAEVDELWIDYDELTPENPMSIAIQLSVQQMRIDRSNGAKLKSRFNLNGGNFDVQTEEIDIDMVGAQWVPKDKRYLIDRFLGRTHDSVWRYTQDGKFVVLQRRFEEDLTNMVGLEMILSSNTLLERLNLRVSTKDDSDLVVDWDSIPKTLGINDKGQRFVHLQIGELLRERFSNTADVTLREIIIFLPGDVEKIIARQPVISLTLLQSGVNNFSQQQSIHGSGTAEVLVRDLIVPSSIQPLNVERSKRLKLDLQSLSQEIGLDSTIVSGKVTPTGFDRKQRSVSVLGDIRFVSFATEEVPLIMSIGKEQLAQLNDRIPEFGDHGSNWWPVLDGYFPFKEEMHVTGIGEGWVEIDWPLQATLFNGTHVQLYGAGWPERVISMRLTAYHGNTKLGSWLTRDGNSTKLTGDWGVGQAVDRIVLRAFVRPASPDANLANKIPNLQGLVIFRPQLQSFDEALDQRVLGRGNVPLVPIVVSQPPNLVTTVKDDEFTALSIDSQSEAGGLAPLSWVTFMNQTFPTRLTLEYNVPPNLLGSSSPKTRSINQPLIAVGPATSSGAPEQRNSICWLRLTMKGDSDQWLLRDLCTVESSGQLGFTLPTWVRQIKWEALWAPSSIFLGDVVRLAANANYVSLITMRELIEKEPLLNWRGKDYFPDTRGLNHYGGMLDLGEILIEKKDFFNLAGFFVDHPWLEVRSVVLEREAPFTLAELDAMGAPTLASQEAGLPGWVRWVLYGLTLIVVWWSARRRWLQGLWRGVILLLVGLWGGPLILLDRLFRRWPQMDRWSGFLASWSFSLLFWLLVSVGLYVGGLLSHVDSIENYGLTFGAVAAVFVWRAFAQMVQPTLARRWPGVAGKVYGGAGVHYISGFIVMLIGAAVMLALRLEPVAEQLAVIGYYLLVVGVALEVWALCREHHEATNSARID